MDRHDLSDLDAFVSIARARSFTKAAARLGVTPSALSHRMRALEERLGVRLLNRTTRSVTPTEAGEKLLGSVAIRLDEIEAELAALSDFRDKPAGTIRINADELAVQTVLMPALDPLLPDYPDITVEIDVDNGMSDIVAEGFDAGVRLGGVVDKDMIAVQIGPDIRMVAVASPDYFATRAKPKHPSNLVDHKCINYRLTSQGGLYAWEFEEEGREITVRVEGQLVFNSIFPVLEAARAGHGIGYVFRSHAAPYLESGELVAVLEKWSPPFSGYHLYYPSRRQPTAAFRVIVDALRYRG